MLMDLGYYSGDINETHDKDTDAAVRAFQNDNGLASDGIVGDQTWAALIEAYLDLDSLAVPEDRFLKNAGDRCDGGVLRWIGCGEQDPVKNTSDAWRPNRRTEILFVKAESLPCKVSKPDTFDIPAGVVGSTWCLGPGNENARCCFLTKDPASKDRWIVQPMEPGNVIVEGSITFDDKTPLANAEYIITAPDGEYMDGEKPLGPNRGRPVPGHTDVQGRFSYPDRPKGVGIYSLEVKEPFIIRLSDKPHEPAKGHLVCKHLEGKSRLDVTVCKPAITFDLEVRGAIKAGIIGTDFVAALSSSEDAIITAVSSAGTCITPRSIVWIGGEEVQGNPIQRRVSRATTGPTTVTATMPASGATRSIIITVISTQLEAIEFNHDSSSASGDALNIRKNKTTFVTVPEWQRGISNLPQDSPAAYAIHDTQGKTVTIKARFKISIPLAIAIEVRAIAPNIRVLGEVKARSISFLPTGETGFESLELENVKIWDKGVGVGIHDIDWKWQLRLQPSDSWTDFASSRHRIYTVLKVPNLPWQQLPYTSGNDQIPWTEVLDHACRWASKEKDIDGAATKVTKEVYDLGKSIIEYDCPGGGGTRYASPSFNCTEFLERLGGGVGLGRYVNCTDCATIVSTFANILGSDLWQSRMGDSFDLNPILAIGSGTWQTACGWRGFSYHEVAWKRACTAGESVFDACLKVDGDSNPKRAPHTPLLVANIRFGNEYRDRLAADSPTGRPKCQPQPATRTRRKII